MSLDTLFIALTAAFSTFFLAKHNQFDGIRASASLSIIAYLVFYYLNLNPEVNSLVFFGGTFVGMSAPHRFGVYTIAIAAGLFAVLFSWLTPLLDGLGGALGLSAFLSVCICHCGILLGAPRSKK